MYEFGILAPSSERFVVVASFNLLPCSNSPQSIATHHYNHLTEDLFFGIMKYVEKIAILETRLIEDPILQNHEISSNNCNINNNNIIYRQIDLGGMVKFRDKNINHSHVHCFPSSFQAFSSNSDLQNHHAAMVRSMQSQTRLPTDGSVLFAGYNEAYASGEGTFEIWKDV